MPTKPLGLITLSVLMLSFAISFLIPPAFSSSNYTIYIRPNGDIYPLTSDIQRVGDLYTLISDLSCSIEIQRDNIVVDGMSHKVEGSGSGKGIVLEGRKNVTIRNMTIDNFEYGVWLDSSLNNSILGNWIWIAWYGTGIQLFRSCRNRISENRVDGGGNSGQYGLKLSDSSNHNNITGNIITANDIDIWVQSSSNNTLSGNTADGVQYDPDGGHNGILLERSSYNTLRGNIMTTHRDYHFEVRGDRLVDFINDIDTSNTVDRDPIVYWTSKRNGTVPIDAGYVALINCTNIVVKNLSIKGNKQGLLLVKTENATIVENTLVQNDVGVESLNSSDNTFYENEIVANNIAMNLSNSLNNHFYGNDIVANGGIFLNSSNNNSFLDNRIRASYVGFLLAWSSKNNICKNNIVENTFCGIWVHSSNNNIICENEIKRNNLGVILESSSNTNVIYRNNITDNTAGGIALSNSNHTRILGNNFVNNRAAIGFADSSNNSVWHNNFFGKLADLVGSRNSVIAWNNSAEGNYWNDYKERYPNATEVDDSGIWGTPYIIDEINRDNHPLIEPWSLTRIFSITFEAEIYKVVTLSNSTIVDLTFNQTDKTIRFKTTGPDGTMGSCNVTIPKELLDTLLDDQWAVTVNSEIVAPSITNNVTHTFIYFTFTHSTKTINIIGTNPIDKTPPVANIGQDQTVYEGTEVTFNGSASTDNVAIKSYVWSFMDKTPQTLSGVNPTYRFTTPGTYVITLNVTDLRGNWNATTMTITVLAVPIWSHWWFWLIIASSASAIISVPFSLKYYRNYKKQKRIILEYESELEALSLAHPDRARARFIKDNIDRKEKIEKFQSLYGIKIRPANAFEDAMRKLGVPVPTEKR